MHLKQALWDAASRALHKVNVLTAGHGHSLTNRSPYLISWEIRLESEWDKLNPEEDVSACLPFAALSMMKFEWQAASPIYFEQLLNTESYNLLISLSTEKHSKQCSAPLYLADWFTVQDNEKILIFTAPTHCMWDSIQKLLSILL